jgi:hypothetical protein
VSYYLFCAFFGVLTLVTVSRLFKFVALGTMIVLVAIGFMIVARGNHGDSSTSS